MQNEMLLSQICELTMDEVENVNGGGACTTAMEWSFGIVGTSLGAIFGGVGAFAGAGLGYNVGSMVAEGLC